ncbi:MAG: glycoside hydrolase family 15 protein [Bryobacteraceae bacterium]
MNLRKRSPNKTLPAFGGPNSALTLMTTGFTSIDGYLPIEAYGVIGDLRSVALVGQNGSIDWCCLPAFDSPSVFGAILDHRKGGRFQIWSDALSHQQMYMPDSNVLLTRFPSRDGVGEVLDFMPLSSRPTSPMHQIVRMVRAVRGQVHFQLVCDPRPDYARAEAGVTLVPGQGAIFETQAANGPFRVALLTEIPLRRTEHGVAAEFSLNQGESVSVVFRYHASPDFDLLGHKPDTEELLNSTLRYWRRWLSKCRYQGRWREMVYRSALCLKLLTYQPTGAIVAAPTCSLPEEIGGIRNWDYRYTWVRDAAFTIFAFLRLGYSEEAAQFMDWLQQRVGEEEKINGPLNVMYGIDGRHEIPEIELDHLEGYRGSAPVRIGNGAAHQLQLDIYGELIDSVYLYNKHSEPISYDFWVQLRRMLDWVARNWELPDEGIWEVRGGKRHFVYSKMQCWVALDRGLRIAAKRGLPVDSGRLRDARDRIYEAIMTKGWDPKRRTFTQAFDSNAIDAANLIMPLTLFLPATDPRMKGTIDAIIQDLVSDSLVYRYLLNEEQNDGLPGREGTFSMCSFWLVEALTRAGRLEEARFVFEKMLTYANHLGLYSEEIGPCGEALGNFPQAFTHLGLISAAYTLNRKLGGKH